MGELNEGGGTGSDYDSNWADNAEASANFQGMSPLTRARMRDRAEKKDKPSSGIARPSGARG